MKLGIALMIIADACAAEEGLALRAWHDTEAPRTDDPADLPWTAAVFDALDEIIGADGTTSHAAIGKGENMPEAVRSLARKLLPAHPLGRLHALVRAGLCRVECGDALAIHLAIDYAVTPTRVVASLWERSRCILSGVRFEPTSDGDIRATCPAFPESSDDANEQIAVSRKLALLRGIVRAVRAEIERSTGGVP